jgi:hypothetical protein
MKLIASNQKDKKLNIRVFINPIFYSRIDERVGG